MRVHYACSCGFRDSYDPATITTKTDKALPDAKHIAKCGGTIVTTTSEAVAADWAARGAAE